MKIRLYFDYEKDSTCFELLEECKILNFTVPVGFCSDGASVPRILWSYCEPINGKYIKVFVLHDFLYYSHLTTRKEADETLYELLKEAGMGTTKAWTIYESVRLFGGSHW